MNEITIQRRLPLVLDSTILSTFRACGTKGLYEYVEGLAPSALSIDLHAGGCIATGLETLYEYSYYKDVAHSVALGAMAWAFEKQWGDFEIPEWKKTTKTKDRCLAALLSYDQMYHPPTDHVTPHPDVEKSYEYSFGIPLTKETTGLAFPVHPVTGDPFIYAGRFDALGRYLGMSVIRDDKTTAAFAMNWEDQWNLRAQFMGYCWAMQYLGMPIECVIVRGICILKGEIKHRETEKRYPRHMIRRWLEITQTEVCRLVESWETGKYHMSLGSECSSYGGCAFQDLCLSPNPDRWKSDYARRWWNPLVRGEDTPS